MRVAYGAVYGRLGSSVQMCWVEFGNKAEEMLWLYGKEAMALGRHKNL